MWKNITDPRNSVRCKPLRSAPPVSALALSSGPCVFNHFSLHSQTARVHTDFLLKYFVLRFSKSKTFLNGKKINFRFEGNHAPCPGRISEKVNLHVCFGGNRAAFLIISENIEFSDLIWWKSGALDSRTMESPDRFAWKLGTP